MASEMVLVRNNDSIEFEQVFKREKIIIPAHKFVKMRRKEAVAFLGTWPGNYPEGHERYDRPEYKHGRAKMLEIIPVGKEEQTIEEEGHTCNFCGLVLPDVETLTEHLESHDEALIKEPKKGKKAATAAKG